MALSITFLDEHPSTAPAPTLAPPPAFVLELELGPSLMNELVLVLEIKLHLTGLIF